MRNILLGFAGAVLAVAATPAFAWGEPGHQVIGSIAWAILNQPGHANARAHVVAILNSTGTHSLADAATWADCVRDVHKVSGGGFAVTYVKGKTPEVCKSAFPQDDEAETAAMIAYVANNWSQCDYTHHGGGQCDLTYHFVDIPYQHGRYAPGDVSVSAHDAVSVIGEAVYYLRSGTDRPGAVAHFSTAREALFVLAHLVGDIHQPLHVGAVYLDAQGNVVDPGQNQTLADTTSTKGGNFIFNGSSQAKSPPELHGDWDKIAGNLGTAASPDLVQEAQEEVVPDAGDPALWPAQWASESVALARDKVFAGLTYSGDGPGKWRFSAPPNYAADRTKAQRLQLERAGVRLAALLEAIWPG